MDDPNVVDNRKWAWQQASRLLDRHVVEGGGIERDVQICGELSERLLSWVTAGVAVEGDGLEHLLPSAAAAVEHH